MATSRPTCYRARVHLAHASGAERRDDAVRSELTAQKGFGGRCPTGEAADWRVLSRKLPASLSLERRSSTCRRRAASGPHASLRNACRASGPRSRAA